MKNRAVFVWLWEVAPVLMVPNLQLEFVHGVFPATLQMTSYIFLYCLMYSYVTNDKASMMTRIEAWLSFAFNPLSFTLYTTSGLLAIIWHAFPWDGTRYVMSEVGWHFMSLLLAFEFQNISESGIILPLILILLAICVEAATVTPLVWATVLAAPPLVAFELLNHAIGVTVKAAKNIVEKTNDKVPQIISGFFTCFPQRKKYPTQKVEGDSKAQ